MFSRTEGPLLSIGAYVSQTGASPRSKTSITSITPNVPADGCAEFQSFTFLQSSDRGLPVRLSFGMLLGFLI